MCKNIKKFIKINTNIILILIIFITYSVLLLLKVKFYGSFTPEWDEGHHLLMGLYFNRAIGSENISWLKDLFINSGQIYPPIYHLLIGLSYKIFGISPNSGIYINIPFILLLMISVYKLGRKVGSSESAILASILTPVLPVFLSLQERTTIDYISVSLFILLFFLLFKTEYFVNRKYSIIFGLVLLLSLLTKWPFLAPSIPFVAYAVYGYIKKASKRKAILTNVVIVFLIIVPSFVWYFANFKFIIKDLSLYWDPNRYPQLLWKNSKIVSWNNLIKYLYTFPSGRNGAGLIVLLFFYYAFISGFKSKGYKRYLLWSTVIIYVILTLLTDKSEYYFAYAYPLLVIMTTESLFNIKRAKLRIILLTTFVLAVFSNFILAQINTRSYKKLTINFAGRELDVLPNYFTKFPSDDWPTKHIVYEHLDKKSCGGSNLLVFPDNRYLSVLGFEFYLSIFDRNIHAVPARDYYDPVHDKVFSIDTLNKFNCILTKTGDPGVFSNKNVMNFVSDYLSKNPDYESVYFDAPDNSTVTLFMKNEN